MIDDISMAFRWLCYTGNPRAKEDIPLEAWVFGSP